MKYMIMTFGDESAWDTLGLGGREATWSQEQVDAHFQAMGEFYGDSPPTAKWSPASGWPIPRTR